MEQAWSAKNYAQHGRFVADLATPVVELLAVEPGERVLDLGCGDGVLTEQIAHAGASVVGVDRTEEFVAATQARGLDARLMDGQSLAFESEFDAVFSNAALHWMPDPDAVITGVRRALRPGGRFVGEMGGHGNVAAIVVAFRAVLARHGQAIESPWYFPSVAEYRGKLESHGFTVDDIALIPRPTPLPTGMANWLKTFGHPMLQSWPEDERTQIEAEVLDLLRPVLCDSQENWTADYVRLRFQAHLPLL